MQQPTKQNTPLVKPKEVRRQWFILDAAGKTLGRFASEVTKILRGKHKPDFTPNIDTGDGVIIINAEKIRVTGAKAAQKKYRYYTGYMSGLREVPYEQMLAKKPHYIIEHAVKGMMPKTRLAKAQLKKLRIVKGDQPQMDSLQPIAVALS